MYNRNMKEILKSEFITPDFVYIPIDKAIRKKALDNIFCEEIIGSKTNREYLYSPVSGIVISESEVLTSKGIKKTLIVENDFRDKRKKIFPSHKSLFGLKKDEILEAFKSFNINLPDKINLKVYYKKNINTDSLLFDEYIEEILEFLDVMNTVLKKEISICIKESDMYSMHSLSKYKETYPNIEVLYNSKKCTDFLTVYEIVGLYLLLKSKRFLTYRYITVINKNKIYNLKTKLYTSIDEILKNLNIEKSNNITALTREKETIQFNKGIIDENIIELIVK